MGTFEIKGFDKLEKQLKRMEKGAKELDGQHDVSFSELFTVPFMQKFTKFSSFDELLAAGGFKVKSNEDFEAIPDADFDKHIASVTKFKNWEEMLGEATEQYICKKLGL
ncbi:hypothetical protein [uncultured Dysosmobacter sp.]|uniref:hypothetical protein n=1 Tax=uncultured Dysosmobacter sp. TaxID=2591384 RepID=UPI00261B92AF|nr:hypothetical protein [uncultured Dysosmobacter sp.]